MNELTRIVVLLVLAVMSVACNGDEEVLEESGPVESPPPIVDALVVESGPLERTVDVTVEILADDVVELAPLETGRLVELNVDRGDRVSAGQIVARLDTDLQDQARQERYAALRTAEARVEMARAELAEQTAEVERRRTLAARNAFPEAELARLEDRLPVLDESVALAQAQLAEARTSVATLDTDVARREIVAPFDGVVIERYVTVGAIVGSNTPIVQIVDPESLEGVAPVGETRLSELSVGTRGRLTLEAAPDEALSARIVRIGDVVDRSARTVEVRLEVDEGAIPLRHGMYGRGELIVESLDNAVLVPREVFGRGPMTSVWTVDDEIASQVEVRVLLETSRIVAVAGIDSGTRVIRNPPRGLQDGGRVRDVNAARESMTSEGSGEAR